MTIRFNRNVPISPVQTLKQADECAIRQCSHIVYHVPYLRAMDFGFEVKLTRNNKLYSHSPDHSSIGSQYAFGERGTVMSAKRASGMYLVAKTR